MTIKKEFDSIYLIWTRESIQLDKPIYKVGKTKRIGLERFKEYPDGSELLFHISCHNCTDKETKIKELFKKKYFQASLYGTEYFGGDPNEMIKDILNITEINVKNVNTTKIAALADLHEKVFPLAKETIQSNKEVIIENNTKSLIESTDLNLMSNEKKFSSKIQQLIDSKQINPNNNLTNDIVTQNNDNKKLNLIENQTEPTLKNNIDVKPPITNNIYCIESNTSTQIINNQPKPNYFCNPCGLTYQTANGLRKHQKKYHLDVENNPDNFEKKYFCNTCALTFRLRQTRWAHEKKCSINQIQNNKKPIQEQIHNLKTEINNIKLSIK